ncbi:hypothetical protein [Sphingomonas sanguinis]|uniref:DUF2946 domain-containing protein n=1 Tax=Sphingomonas sanguinis TaxID=33051 RepID=A0A7Y7QZ90_9SPHN|nr:hypothetical protein [Sphingomonas sanguinis]MBZ6383467.1 hypothetical protein [Sphingomonas sanguinis]NNG48689.1 hypothetical protein [Sphingomonas sanguinis]NNG51934.1 hypothetical protein [Sphingomonas sanguinis]NVP32763.1 hypothetical protein [Sphingomonas sanguinis]
MTAIRCLLAQRHLAVLLCAAALLLKLIVPTGYMIGTVQGRAAIILCPSGGPMPQAAPTTHDAMAMDGHEMLPKAGTAHPVGHSGGSHGRDMPCAFAGLAAAGLAATDPVHLALLIAFVMAVARVPLALPRLDAAPYLRPPLRGPPALS